MSSKILKTLESARKIIEENNHVKNSYAKDSEGNPVPYCSESASCFCVSGAIQRALYNAEGNHNWSGQDFVQAMSALREHLPDDLSGVVDYNDLSTTTKEDILTLFDKAIESEQNRES